MTYESGEGCFLLCYVPSYRKRKEGKGELCYNGKDSEKRSEDFLIYTSLDEDKGSPVETAVPLRRKPRSLASDLWFELCLSVCLSVCLSLSERQSSVGCRSLMAGNLSVQRKSHHVTLCKERNALLTLVRAALYQRGETANCQTDRSCMKNISFFAPPPPRPPFLLLFDFHRSLLLCSFRVLLDFSSSDFLVNFFSFLSSD
jgi:hypothetical protein